jgi:hypothetical protein
MTERFERGGVLTESPTEARKRRREWRSTLAHTPEWLIGSAADVSNPSDAELDAIWDGRSPPRTCSRRTGLAWPLRVRRWRHETAGIRCRPSLRL